MLEESNLMLLIPTQLKMELVSLEEALLLDMPDLEATISPKEIKPSLKKDCTMLDQSLFHSKSLVDSKTMYLEFIKFQIVEKLLMMLITLF